MNTDQSGSFRVVVDTSSNVPESLLRELGMLEVATSVLFGDDQFRLKRDIDLPRFYELLASRPEHPTTSQPSPQQFQEAYARALRAGAARVICVTVSAKVSGTFNSARLAAREFPDGTVVMWDSQAVSIASGFQAIAAARMAQAGLELEEVLVRLEKIRAGIQSFITVENLDTLARSGRVSALQKNMGNMLNLKPILTVDQGEVKPIARVRGRRRAKAEMLARIAAALGSQPVILAVSHARVREEAEAFMAEAQRRLNVTEGFLTEQDPAIVALGGVGTLGIGGYRVE